jgi:predicted nucleotidyltransferase
MREFCRRWKIVELALFGSVLRKDFRPDSDVDVLVTFAPTAHPTLLDLAHMQTELKTLFGREVDLLTRRGVEASREPVGRQGIMSKRGFQNESASRGGAEYGRGD